MLATPLTSYVLIITFNVLNVYLQIQIIKVSTYKDTNQTSLVTMKVLLIFSVLFGTSFTKILLPFADNHDSLFSYQLSTKNISSSLETSGKIVVQKQNNQIKLNFFDTLINRSENLLLQSFIDRINMTPILFIDQNGNFEWDPEPITFEIDPLLIKENFRLSAFPEDFIIDDEIQTSPEEDGKCGFEVRKVNETQNDVFLRFSMSLKGCQNELIPLRNDEDHVTDGSVEVLWGFDKSYTPVLTKIEFKIQLIANKNLVESNGIVNFIKFLPKSVK